MATRAERETYVQALLNRLHEKVIDVAPPGLGAVVEFWDLMIEVDKRVLRACDQYEAGRIGKTDLDRVAVKYLHHLRTLIQEREDP